MIEYAQTLRTRLAAVLPASVLRNSGPLSAGKIT
ncbi:Uncharacterised protein [Mycobacteroides abscessus subsp. abscessus]|nr:Uncharacterised protein [Mycobacteroides abscessus subsp. abscessus]